MVNAACVEPVPSKLRQGQSLLRSLGSIWPLMTSLERSLIAAGAYRFTFDEREAAISDR